MNRGLERGFQTLSSVQAAAIEFSPSAVSAMEKASMSTNNPAADRQAWFHAWIAGGIALVVVSWVLAELYFDFKWYIEQTFQLVNPSPDWKSKNRIRSWIEWLPLLSLAYALVGVWRFRRRGCAVIAIAALIAGLSWFPLYFHGWM